MLAAARCYSAAKRAFGSHGLCLVKVKKHGRMLLHGDQHVFEFTQEMRTNRIHFQQASKARDCQFVSRNGKMVGPEMDQPLHEGGIAVNSGCEPYVNQRG